MSKMDNQLEADLKFKARKEEKIWDSRDVNVLIEERQKKLKEQKEHLLQLQQHYFTQQAPDPKFKRDPEIDFNISKSWKKKANKLESDILNQNIV